MKTRNILLILATLLLALALSMVALAEPPAPGTASDITLAGIVASKISYQGRLTDASGNPLTGTYNLVFQLWDAVTGGNQVGSDIVKNNVSVNNGLFTVDLDVPQSAFNGQALWLRIQVGGQWLTPRQELLPVPYALGLRPGAWIQGNSTSAAVVTVTNQALGTALYAQGFTGIQGVGGMTGVSGQGDVGVAGAGMNGVSGSGSLVGVYGTSAGGYGVRGSTSGPMTATVAGVYGSGDNAIGVMGTSITGTGGFFTSTHGTGAVVETVEGYGLYVQSGDNFGIYAHSGHWMNPIYLFGHIGVYGEADSIGVEGNGLTGGYFSGQQGVQASGTMTGVIGTASNTGGRGVIGIADNYSGIGVSGSGGFGIGVQGKGEIGVKGVGSVGDGVWGEGATGVHGNSQSGSGVWGTSTSGYGVMGNSVNGPGGYFTSTNSAGVAGTGEIGVKGISPTDLPPILGDAAGVYGQFGSFSGWYSAGNAGVRGDSATGSGVIGTTDTGYGVVGLAGSSSGFNRGVTGESFSPDGYGGYFYNTGGGTALYATGNGGTANRATLRVNNSKSGDGMAAYLTNNSGFHTAHLYNAGSGGVLYLQNGGTDASGTGGWDFITAVNKPENDAQFRVLSSGEVRSDVGFYTPASDFAEMLPAAEGLEPGDVLVIGPDGTLTRSTESYQASVAGVYSTQPGFLGGQPVQGEAAGTVPLAITGVVPVMVSAENGPIRPGDLLVTSSIPGHAMKAGPNPPQGTVIGKALEKLDAGTGVIKILATLQ
jgi:hypothetical protein